MAEKKEYQAVLKIISAVATIATASNNLEKAAIDTEDAKLKAGLVALAQHVRRHGKTSQKIHLAGLPKGTTLQAMVSQVNAYCEAALASIKPQWQILAEQAGWSPPPA